MNIQDFFNLEKDLQRIHVAGGQTDGRLCVTDDREDMRSTYPAEVDDDDPLGYVEVEREKKFEIAEKFAHLDEGLTGMTTYENLENLNALLADETQEIFKRFPFLHEVRRDLPIFSLKEEILNKIESSNVSVITGPTGCGKTTQVPQYVLDECWQLNKHRNIVVTQPRRIAAVSIASRVCDERSWEVGTLCGYQIGLNQVISEDTRLLYCTTGVLLHKLLKTRSISKYTHIFLDEVHERSQELDFVMLILRQLLHKSDTKLILMSATMDPGPYITYFESGPLTSGKIPLQSLWIDVVARSKHPVAIYYVDDLDEAEVGVYSFKEEIPELRPFLVEICVRLVVKLDAFIDPQCQEGVLVFLPGIVEIETVHKLLLETQNADREQHKWVILPLHSSIPREDQNRVLHRVSPGHRKIILATNIAESSITVPDVSVVIDFCLMKNLQVNEETGLHTLKLQWASQDMCKQRAGRVGRVGVGRVYRLLPKAFFFRLSEHNMPDMLTAPLENIVLNAKVLDMGSPLTVLAQAMDPPPKHKILQAVINLKEAGGLLLTANGSYHRTDGDLTFLGKMMAALPVDIKIAKLIALGYIFGVLEEAIIIGAALSQQYLFCFPFGKKMESYKALVLWAYGTCSDHMACLNAYEGYRRESLNCDMKGADEGGKRRWATSVFLELRALKEMDVLIREITNRLNDLSIESWTGKYQPWNEDERYTILKFAIAGAFYPNYFTTVYNVDKSGKIEGSAEAEAIRYVGGANPMNSVYLTQFPRDQPGLLYTKAIQTLMKCCDTDLPRISFARRLRKVVQWQIQDNILDPSMGDWRRFVWELQGRIQAGLNEKVVVEFRPESIEDGLQGKRFVSRRIPQSVYTAVMMRKLNILLKFSILPVGMANELASKWCIKDIRDTLPTFEMASPEEVLREQSNLPSLNITTIAIVLVDVIDPGHFMAAYSEQFEVKKLSKLKRVINESTHEPLQGNPVHGGLYLVQRKGVIARARVEKILDRNKKVKVLFIDEGDRQFVSFNDLLKPEEGTRDIVYSTPAYLLECRLAQLQPAMSLAQRRVWSQDAKKFFIKATNNHLLYGVVYSVVEGVVNLELKSQPDPEEPLISINELLISQGYAERATENYFSKLNHSYRTTNLDPAVQKLHDDSQRPSYWSAQTAFDLPSHPSCSNANLRGPRSPLELSVRSILSRQEQFNVNVAPESVNCVILNEHPEDTRSMLLVASGVSQSGQGNINLRQTTLMPDIIGLPALLALLFAPRAQMKTDELGVRYTSAVCGMGCGSNGEPLFPDHDFDIVFDSVMSPDDIRTINVLRREISSLLLSDTAVGFPNYSRNELLTAVKRMRESFAKLIKIRQPQTVTFPQHHCKWAPMEAMPTSEEARYILPPHSIPPLQDVEEIAHELNELLAMCKGSIPFEPSTCPLCQVRLPSRKFLLAHAKSAKHRELEASIHMTADYV